MGTLFYIGRGGKWMVRRDGNKCASLWAPAFWRQLRKRDIYNAPECCSDTCWCRISAAAAREGDLMPDKGDLVTILPEYCDHEFFTGWHLYEREHADGKRRNRDGDWGWLQGSLNMARVRELCVGLGHIDMPEVTHWPGAGEYERFVDDFARRFPAGILARIMDYHKYEPAPPKEGEAQGG